MSKFEPVPGVQEEAVRRPVAPSEWLYSGGAFGRVGLQGTTTGRIRCDEPATSQRPQANALRAAVDRLRAAGACVVSLDYRHAEERVLAHMAAGGSMDEAAVHSLQHWLDVRVHGCPWDAWKPGRDVA